MRNNFFFMKQDVKTKEKKVEVESQVSIKVPVEIPSKEISHYLCLSNQVLHVLAFACLGTAYSSFYF